MNEKLINNHEEPIYRHNCLACVFLGNTVYKTDVEDDVIYDLYYCNQGGVSTLVGRYGNEVMDYISGMAFKDEMPLSIAYERAKIKGLIKEEML